MFKNYKKGVSLYLALIIMFILIAIGLGVSLIIVSQMKMIRGMGDSVVAFYAADTGIEHSLYNKRVKGETGEIFDTPLGEASYEVTKIVGEQKWESVGSFKEVKRAVEISYPPPPPPVTVTLYPNANVSVVLLPWPAGRANWDCVNETPADDTDYVGEEDQTTFQDDLYSTSSPSIPAGSTINSVTVYFRVEKSGIKASYARPRIRALAQAITEGTAVALTDGVWADKSQTWTTNPVTGVAWTVDEVNDLDIGVSLRQQAIGVTDGLCSQLYAVIN
jgi:hypothetical protein